MDDDASAAARAARARSKDSPFLNAREAAHYLDLSYRTLEKMRIRREGPPFRRHGRFIRYHIDDLDTWSRASGGHRDRRAGSDA